MGFLSKILGLFGVNLNAVFGVVIVGLAGAVGWFWVQSQFNAHKIETLNNDLNTMSSLLDSQKRETRLVQSQYSAISETLTQMTADNAKRASELSTKLGGLKSIKQTKGDTHETIDCLARPVPVQLDGWLRDGASAN